MNDYLTSVNVTDFEQTNLIVDQLSSHLNGSIDVLYSSEYERTFCVDDGEYKEIQNLVKADILKFLTENNIVLIKKPNYYFCELDTVK